MTCIFLPMLSKLHQGQQARTAGITVPCLAWLNILHTAPAPSV